MMMVKHQQVIAEDWDEGVNGLVTYRIQTRGNTSRDDVVSRAVSVDKFKGVLMLVNRLPPGRIMLFVEASDSPLNPSETRTSLAVVTIE